jgi:hypothetical protein
VSEPVTPSAPPTDLRLRPGLAVVSLLLVGMVSYLLLCWLVPSDPVGKEVEELLGQRRLIRTSPANPLACGLRWTLAVGTEVIFAEKAEALLTDKFRLIEQPQPSDIIVYRDEAGRLVHSGRVKAVGRDGIIMIESVWGRQGRFLHAPDVVRGYARHEYYSSATVLKKAVAGSSDTEVADEAMCSDE